MRTERAEFLLVTKEMADRWLQENNINNRKLRMWWVMAIAGMITRSEFMTTHQGVAFTRSGRLVDGQHRLKGISVSGIPCFMLVVTGLNEDVFRAIDSGLKRSTAELTELPTKCAQVCAYIGEFIYGKSRTPDLIIKIAKTGISEIHHQLIEYCGSHSLHVILKLLLYRVALFLYGQARLLILLEINMKHYIKKISQRKTSKSGQGTAIVKYLSCRAKTIAGISTAKKSTFTQSFGFLDISCCSDNQTSDWHEKEF